MQKAWKSSLPSLPQEKAKHLKTSDFACIHQRTEVAGQPTTLKYGHKWNQRVIAKICLSGTEAASATNWEEHLNGYFDEFQEAECGLAQKWETSGGHSFGRNPQPFHGFYLQKSKFSWWRPKKDPPYRGKDFSSLTYVGGSVLLPPQPPPGFLTREGVKAIPMEKRVWRS